MSPSTTTNSLDGFIVSSTYMPTYALSVRENHVILQILLLSMLLISMRTSVDGGDFETLLEFSFQIATAVG